MAVFVGSKKVELAARAKAYDAGINPYANVAAVYAAKAFFLRFAVFFCGLRAI